MGMLREYIFDNFKLKVISILIAIMLWFAISYIGESRMSVSVHITLQNLKKNFIVRKVEPDDVLLTISGPVSTLKNMRAKDIKVTVDLSMSKSGSNIYNLQKSNVVITKGVKIEEIKPDYIIIEVGRAIEK